MNANTLLSTVLLLFVSLTLHAQLFRPYKCGPVLRKDMIPMFDTLNRYLGIKPGYAFAEVGASSGYYNGAMAVYLDSVTFYLQDVDESCLNRKNLRRLLDYYSRYRETPITQSNTFKIVIGTDTKTRLPENTMDLIYSNATFHVLEYPDSIIADLRRSLKDGGTLSIRDQFSFEGEEIYCQDKKCGHRLVSHDELINLMKRNGFVLIDRTDRFGYPIYKFKKTEQ